AAVLPDDGTLHPGPLFRGGSNQLRRGGLLQAPDAAVTACRGQDSNLHGSRLPRDFKSLASTDFATPARINIAPQRAASRPTPPAARTTLMGGSRPQPPANAPRIP